jgi:voltage-gated potassium channel
MAESPPKSAGGLRERLREIIFGTDTAAGRAFDVVLLWVIVLSVLVVLFESVASLRQQYGTALRVVEWVFTILFSIEYILRIYSAYRPRGYVFSFFGFVDLLAVIPTYLSFFFAGAQSLIVIRSLRLLRVFRVLKLTHYLGEAQVLLVALRASRRKITVFLGGVLATVLIVGSAMYLVEGEASGFSSIPRAMYWAIVTMTTVGYGDIAPVTVPGQFLAAILMILGYGVIAVPTGIVSAEMVQQRRHAASARTCPTCYLAEHDEDAGYCKHCGTALGLPETTSGRNS